MSDVINLLSRAKNSDSLEATKALLEEALTQVGTIITSKDRLQSDLEKANEAKRAAEEKASGLETELSEAKKGIPSKAKLDKLEAYEALGTTDELSEKLNMLETENKDLKGKVRKTELANFGLKPIIFEQFFSDVTPAYEGEGDEQTIIYKRGEDVVKLEDLAKEKGLEVSDLKKEVAQPDPAPRVIEQVGDRKAPSGVTVDKIVQEKAKSNLYQA